MTAVAPDRIAAELGRAARRLARRLRQPHMSLPTGWLELAARVGYGARGFVYLTVGLITVLAAADVLGEAAGTSEAVAAVARQPFGRLWLILLGAGLWAFVLWRGLQAALDADRQGHSAKALATRAGQALSGVFYALIASTVFELLDEIESSPTAQSTAENQEKAAMLLSLPFGDLLLWGVGFAILAIGVGNVVRAVMDDFTDGLGCSERLRRRLSMLARAGYAARGLAYLPLTAFTFLAAHRSSSAEVTSFGDALQALESMPAGSWLLAATGAGLMAFGAFAFVEARFRRIREPRLPG
ncbi:DUF1206 domain-containing protein [Brevundimonas balnearis]|uniref:DUF1206 domain-containing protein n=1 Tax=Brevundimonas balnearis TaxID=1572858 RepID=A0ABV6R542_9CAUL